jgi:hypothetical protein
VPERESTPEMVPVLQSRDEGLMAIAQSILSDAKINFVIVDWHTQDLVGYGRIGYNPLIAARIMVSSADMPVAQELLKEVINDSAEPQLARANPGPAIKNLDGLSLYGL